MCKKRCVHAVSVVLLWAALLFPGAAVRAGAIISDHDAVAEFDEIPASVIEDIRSNYRIYYGHTSHGSQITNGLDLLTTENSLYAQPYFREVIDDLGDYGDTSWVPVTRSDLNSHPDINIVMWSWCGGVTDNTEDGINAYLNAMNRLEQDYPDITFVYMTGHLDGTGPSGGLYVRNNQIRDYCRANSKVLFDFADIESYDPDGIYYPDEDDGCGWCYSWCSSHFCYTCSYCAHSHCFNCYLKGKAWWWMMAMISGWGSVDSCVGFTGNIDCSPVQAPDISDMQRLIDHLFISMNPVCCVEEADVDVSGQPDPLPEDVDISDVQLLIDHLFINMIDLPACP